MKELEEQEKEENDNAGNNRFENDKIVGSNKEIEKEEENKIENDNEDECVNKTNLGILHMIHFNVF